MFPLTQSEQQSLAFVIGNTTDHRVTWSYLSSDGKRRYLQRCLKGVKYSSWLQAAGMHFSCSILLKENTKQRKK